MLSPVLALGAALLEAAVRVALRHAADRRREDDRRRVRRLAGHHGHVDADRCRDGRDELREGVRALRRGDALRGGWEDDPPRRLRLAHDEPRELERLARVALRAEGHGGAPAAGAPIRGVRDDDLGDGETSSDGLVHDLLLVGWVV